MLKKVISIIFSLCLVLSVSAMAENVPTETTSDMSQRAGMPQRGEMSFGEFTPPEGNFAPPQDFGGFTPSQENGENVTTPQTSGTEQEKTQAETKEGETTQTQNQNSPFGGQMPEGMEGFFGNMQNDQNANLEQETGFSSFVKTYSTPIISVVLLGLAFIFVILYRRKNY